MGTLALNSHVMESEGVCREGGIQQDILHGEFKGVILFPHPAWPLVDGALLVSKGGARPQTIC